MSPARRLLAGGPKGLEAREKKEATVDRDKMLDVTLQQIEKQFGKGAVMKLGEHPAGAGVSVIPTGSLALDLALGIGGVPRGRIMEVFGPEGSGKTTVCLHIIAEAQANGGIAAFIDAEHALDPTYARELGVNIDELLVSQPDSGEQALEIADMLVRSAALDLVVIDSVAALVPRAEIEGEMGDTHVGLQARLMSQAMRKLSGTLSKFDTTAIFINQLREKIGVMFGSPETTPGGRALKFYSSVRLDVRKIENLKDGTEVVGSRTRVKVVKNKVAPPFRQCEFDIMYGKGISKEGSLIDVGVDLEIIKKSGAWFTYEGEQLGQGRENARAFLAEHIDVRDEIERKIREAVGISAFGDEGDETPIEIVPDVVLDEERLGADHVRRQRHWHRQGEGQGRRRRLGRRADGVVRDRCEGLASVEESQDLPRASPRTPGGAPARPPGARAALARGGLRGRRGRRRTGPARAGGPHRRRGLREAAGRAPVRCSARRAASGHERTARQGHRTRPGGGGRATLLPTTSRSEPSISLAPASVVSRVSSPSRRSGGSHPARAAGLRARGRAVGGAPGPRGRRPGLGRSEPCLARDAAVASSSREEHFRHHVQRIPSVSDPCPRPRTQAIRERDRPTTARTALIPHPHAHSG